MKTGFVQCVKSVYTGSEPPPPPPPAESTTAPQAGGDGDGQRGGKGNPAKARSGSEGQAARLPASAADACTSQPALRGSLPI